MADARQDSLTGEPDANDAAGYGRLRERVAYSLGARATVLPVAKPLWRCLHWLST